MLATGFTERKNPALIDQTKFAGALARRGLFLGRLILFICTNCRQGCLSKQKT
jgi:hypothetical protein